MEITLTEIKVICRANYVLSEKSRGSLHYVYAAYIFDCFHNILALNSGAGSRYAMDVYLVTLLPWGTVG